MTRFRVEILPEAEAEIREAFLWYFDRSPIAAEAFRTETLEAIDRLAVNALMWPADEDAIRRHVLRHFPCNEGLGLTVGNSELFTNGPEKLRALHREHEAA